MKPFVFIFIGCPAVRRAFDRTYARGSWLAVLPFRELGNVSGVALIADHVYHAIIEVTRDDNRIIGT